MIHIPFQPAPYLYRALMRTQARPMPGISWRPGFARHIRSLDPDLPNYFEDMTDYPSILEHHWLVGVQTESTLGQSCAGPNAQSLPINVGGPLTLAFEPHEDKNAIRLRTNFIDYPHPCPGETWTWFSVMDHISAGGGPLPDANSCGVYIDLIYNEATQLIPTRLGNISGISRMGVTWQGFWGGKSILVDVDLYQHSLWGDAHPAPDVVLYTETESYHYVILNGAKLGHEFSIQLNRRSKIYLPFNVILYDLIQRGILPAPEFNVRKITVSTGFFTECHKIESIAADCCVYDYKTLG